MDDNLGVFDVKAANKIKEELVDYINECVPDKTDIASLISSTDRFLIIKLTQQQSRIEELEDTIRDLKEDLIFLKNK